MNIEPFGYAEILAADVNEETIKYSIDRNWATVSETKPKATAKREELTMTVTQPYTGMSEDELKESKKNEVPVEAAVGTALGQGTTVEVTPETEVKETTKKSAKAK